MAARKSFNINELGNPNTRIASLDFQRGIAIWLMTFLHTFEHVYDYNWVKENPGKVFDLPIYVLIIGLTVGFFASWNAYFLLISATVNSLSMTRKSLTGSNPRDTLIKQLITGGGIYLVGIINDSFLYGGYFGAAFRTGDWSNTYPLWNGFFAMNTLQIIALCIIINGFIHYLLMRNNGYERFRRNIAMYGFLIVLVVIFSPLIHNWVDNLPWEAATYIPPELGLGDYNKWPNVVLQANNASFKAFILTILAGDMEPLFPYLATSFAGSLAGLALARPKPIKKLPLIGGLSSLGIMGLGGMFLALGFFTMGNNRPALGNYLLMLGGQLGMIFLFLGLVEYRGRAKKFASRKIVKHFRFWSIISLSVYCLAIIELLPRKLFGVIYNLLFSSNHNFMHTSLFGYGEELHAIAMAVAVILFFEMVLYYWSKINFKFSFEWFIIGSTALKTKERSKRLNVQHILDESLWYNPKVMLELPIVSLKQPELEIQKEV
ncbi:MAG: hypothetical protein JXA54_11530 [Candidatus Heimdallarchaeota archaeon]|nr:hypothetical protein [Candidatus Heimdallarchaeota archaeon]